MERRSIPSWCREDQPRERLYLKGKASLSTSELLAIVIGSGSARFNALAVSQQILQSVDHELHRLSALNVEELCTFHGIGRSKAIRIIATMELARRRLASEAGTVTLIRSSQDAYVHLKAELEEKDHEEFWVLLLNRRNQLIRSYRVSEGGISGTLVDPKRVFKMALDHQASGIIIGHNHPSGNAQPSQADLRLTQRIKAGAQQLDIQLLDHLIIAFGSYYSFADEQSL